MYSVYITGRRLQSSFRTSFYFVRHRKVPDKATEKGKKIRNMLISRLNSKFSNIEICVVGAGRCRRGGRGCESHWGLWFSFNFWEGCQYTNVFLPLTNGLQHFENRYKTCQLLGIHHSIGKQDHFCTVHMYITPVSYRV